MLTLRGRFSDADVADVAKLALTDLAQQPGGLKALRLLAAPEIQNKNPDHGCDHQRATESRCQCPVIYCRDLHVFAD